LGVRAVRFDVPEEFVKVLEEIEREVLLAVNI